MTTKHKVQNPDAAAPKKPSKRHGSTVAKLLARLDRQVQAEARTLEQLVRLTQADSHCDPHHANQQCQKAEQG